MIKLFEKMLSGGDLRSIGNANAVVSKVKDQNDFDELFNNLFNEDRVIVMRSADAIEKITIKNPKYLSKHKTKLIELFFIAENKELKWHLALLISRVNLSKKEFTTVWDTLVNWAKDESSSKLVRVAAIQGLYEMMKQDTNLKQLFVKIMLELENENIPSMNARIRNIRKEIG